MRSDWSPSCDHCVKFINPIHCIPFYTSYFYLLSSPAKWGPGFFLSCTVYHVQVCFLWLAPDVVVDSGI